MLFTVLHLKKCTDSLCIYIHAHLRENCVEKMPFDGILLCDAKSGLPKDDFSVRNMIKLRGAK
jgi:hypothetical protein